MITTRFAASLPHVRPTELRDPAYVRWTRLAENPATPEDVLAVEVLRELATEPDPMVRRTALFAASLPADLVVHLAGDPDADVRRCAAFRDDISPALRDQLANDPDEDVREAVENHESLRAHTYVPRESPASSRSAVGRGDRT